MPVARFLRFALAGALATGIQYLVLIALVRGWGAAPVLASCAGFALSAGCNYALNYHYTFRSGRRHREALWRFAILACGGLLLNGIIMRLLLRLGAGYLLAQGVATLLVLAWNFAGHSLWTFGLGCDARLSASDAAARSRTRHRF